AWHAACTFMICSSSQSRPAAEIKALSLHDALPIFDDASRRVNALGRDRRCEEIERRGPAIEEHQIESITLRADVGIERDQRGRRSEEHTSELQSPYDLVCRLLLEKKKIADLPQCRY